MKKLFVLMLSLFLLAGCSKVTSKKSDKKLLSGFINVEMSVKDYGKINLKLNADVAPITVTNFVNLVNEGFYNNLTFHRIIKDFMIQGGDPLHNGTGGSKNKIKGEFKDNGVNNNISHKKGVISMARSSDYDSASSQFFIVTKDSTFLDGEYAAFGVVTSGLDVVLKISDVKAIDDNGAVEYKNQPVIEYIKVVND